MNQQNHQAKQNVEVSGVWKSEQNHLEIGPIPQETTAGSDAPQAQEVSSPTVKEDVPIGCCEEDNVHDLAKSCISIKTEENSTIYQPQPSDSEMSVIQQEVRQLNISEKDTTPKKSYKSPIPSKVEIKQESDSLKNLLLYDGSSDSEGSDAENKNESTSAVKPSKSKTKTNKSAKSGSIRQPLDDTSESSNGSSSDSESDSTACTLSSESDSDSSVGVFDHSDDDSGSVIITGGNGDRREGPNKGAVKKAQNKIGNDDILPPIPDLSQLTINSDVEFTHIGRVSAIIIDCVTITTMPNTPAFDIDTMLFINDGTQKKKKPLGPIYDVLGPVSEPIYCVRFNNEDEVKVSGVKSGMDVFAAPKSEEFTKFVFVKELLKLKGTDASWLNDQEQPIDLVEFSDDEEERAARRGNKSSGKRKLEDSAERHRRYERTMNQCNTLQTRVCKLMDTHRTLSRHIHHHQPRHSVAAAPQADLTPPPVPPEFNPTVPPPGYGPFGFGLTQPGLSPAISPNPDMIMSAPVAMPLAGYSFNHPPSAVSGSGAEGPPGHWNRSRLRSNVCPSRMGSRQNPDNYFTNNGRNYRYAGPSTQNQPF